MKIFTKNFGMAPFQVYDITLKEVPSVGDSLRERKLRANLFEILSFDGGLVSYGPYDNKSCFHSTFLKEEARDAAVRRVQGLIAELNLG